MKLKFIYLFAVLAMLAVTQSVRADVTLTADNSNNILYYGDYINEIYFGGTGSSSASTTDAYKGASLNNTIDKRAVGVTKIAALSAGDVISITCCGGSGGATNGVSVYLSNASGTASSFDITASEDLSTTVNTTITHTVTASDALSGQTSFYIGKKDNDVYVSAIKISRNACNVMTSVLSASTTYTFDGIGTGDVSSTIISNNLMWLLGTGKTMTITDITAKPVTVGSSSYTSYVNSHVAGSSSSNAFMFYVPAGCGKVTVVANSNNGYARTLNCKVGNDAMTKSIVKKAADAEYTFDYSAAYDLPIYIYGTSGGIKVYAIKWEPTTPTVELGATGYATYCSPCNLDLTKASFKAYIASSYDDGTLTMTQATKIPAGTGIIIKGTPNLPCDLTTSAPVPSISTNLLVGVTTDTEVPASSKINTTDYYNFILTGTNTSDVIFKKSFGGTLAANKAYLQLPATAFATGGAASIQQIDFDGQTTDINEIMNINTAATDSYYYNLQGVKVDNPSHGLYIHN